MKIIILKSNLIEGLSSVEKSVSNNQNFPILKNIKLEVDSEKGEIRLISTDLEIAITKKITGKIIKEGETLVPFLVFNKIIRNLNSEKINLESKDNKLMITSDNYEGVINCEKVDDYPIIPEIQNNGEFIKLKTDNLTESLGKTLVATNHSDIRPEINGVYFYYDRGDLFLVGTDGFKLVEKVIQGNQLETNIKEVEIIVPLKMVEILIKTLSVDGDTEILIDSNQVLFKGDGIEIISRVISGKFPDYKAVIPTEKKTEVFIDKDELESAIKTTSSFSGKANDVCLRILEKGKILEVSSSETSLGENKYRVPIRIKGEKEKKEIIFNWKYLRDGLSVFDNSEVVLGINDPGKAMAISVEGDGGLVYVVMPIRS